MQGFRLAGKRLSSGFQGIGQGQRSTNRFVFRSPLLAGLMFALACVGSAQTNVLTYHNDNSRTGQNLTETILKPSVLNSTTFQNLWLAARGRFGGCRASLRRESDRERNGA